jgi:hypothetical protein
MARDPSDVRYCATAVIDLLGFSAHLETGSNDVRTTIGRAAIDRLQVLARGGYSTYERRVECPPSSISAKHVVSTHK